MLFLAGMQVTAIDMDPSKEEEAKKLGASKCAFRSCGNRSTMPCCYAEIMMQQLLWCCIAHCCKVQPIMALQSWQQ